MNFYEFYRLLNEYGQSLIQTLIEKFQKEDPSLTQTIIRNYIDKFERIKNNLPEKDITKYNWTELENAVDGYQSSNRIKAGRLDPTVSDANLLFNKNNIRIYLGKDKKSCIKYSNGYSFCIGARGSDNMYVRYRIDKKGTPYFIFNDNLPKENPSHVLVLFVYEIQDRQPGDRRQRYSVTDSLNRGDVSYNSLSDIIKNYPWVDNIKNFVDDNKGNIEVDLVEKIEHYLEAELESEKVFFEYSALHVDDEENISLVEKYFLENLKKFIRDSNYKNLKELLNNTLNIAKIVMFWPGHGYSKKDEFLVFYKNENDILKVIKSRTKKLLYEDFKYKESEEEIKEKISKALKSKPENPIDEIDSHIEHKAIQGGYCFEVFVEKNSDYDVFYVKVTNPKEFIVKFIDLNKDKINKLNNFYLNYNKAINYIHNQSKEKLEAIMDYYENGENLGRPSEKPTDLIPMIDIIMKFIANI